MEKKSTSIDTLVEREAEQTADGKATNINSSKKLERSMPEGVLKTNNGHLITPDIGADEVENPSNSFNDPVLFPSLTTPTGPSQQRALTPPSTRGREAAEAPLLSLTPQNRDRISERSPEPNRWYSENGVLYSGLTPAEISFSKLANQDPKKYVEERLAFHAKNRSARLRKKGVTADDVSAQANLDGGKGKSSGKGKSRTTVQSTASEKHPLQTTNKTSTSLKPKLKVAKPYAATSVERMTTRGTKRRLEEQEQVPQSLQASPQSATLDPVPSPAENVPEPATFDRDSFASTPGHSTPIAPAPKRAKTLTPFPDLAAIRPTSTPKTNTKTAKKKTAVAKQKRSETKHAKTPSKPQELANKISAHLTLRVPEDSLADWVLPTGEVLKCTKTACANLYEDAWMPDPRTLNRSDAKDLYDAFPTKRNKSSTDTVVKKSRTFYEEQRDPCLQFVHPKEASVAAAVGWKTLHDYLTQKRRMFLGYAEMMRQGCNTSANPIRVAHAQKIANCDVNKTGDMHKAYEAWGWLNSIPPAYVNRKLTSITPEGNIVEMEDYLI